MPTLTRPRLTALVAAALLAGCAGSIPRSVVTANLAQEEAANQLLLLNIARAHERMPMHFSQIGQIRVANGGFGLGVPTLGIDLPFDGAEGQKLSLGLDGQTPVDVTALGNQEFVRGITTPITPEQVAFFANQGWPTAFLMHLFFESINTLDQDGKVVERLQNNPGAKNYPQFLDYVANASACSLESDEDSLDPSFLSSTLTAVAAREAVEIAKAKLRLVPVTEQGQADTTKDLPKTRFRVASVSKEAVLRLQPPPAGALRRDACLRAIGEQAAPTTPIARDAKALAAARTLFPADLARRIAASGKAGDAPVRQFVLRSPEGMLYYLGQLSRAQNGNWLGADSPLKVTLDDGSQAVLFSMRKGGDGSDARVAVAYAGQTFSVGASPKAADGLPEHRGTKAADRPAEDRSMTVLALMQLILGLQDKGAEAPAASSVRLVR